MVCEPSRVATATQQPSLSGALPRHIFADRQGAGLYLQTRTWNCTRTRMVATPQGSGTKSHHIMHGLRCKQSSLSRKLSQQRLKDGSPVCAASDSTSVKDATQKLMSAAGNLVDGSKQTRAETQQQGAGKPADTSAGTAGVSGEPCCVFQAVLLVQSSIGREGCEHSHLWSACRVLVCELRASHRAHELAAGWPCWSSLQGSLGADQTACCLCEGKAAATLAPACAC